MKNFYVYAQTTLPVFSDGTVDCDPQHAQDNITKYYVDEFTAEGRLIRDMVEYDPEHFDKIAEEHPASEWNNYDW